MAATHFRLVTYNIHKGIGGVDRRYRPLRIVEALARCRPDIILLQEVDDGARRSGGHRQVELLGDALGLKHRAFQPNVKLKRGVYGNAILSRFPLVNVRNLDLTVPLKKRRRVLGARCKLHIDGHAHGLQLFNFHLGLAGMERVVQLRRFLKSELLTRIHHETPVVAAGDFNDLYGNLDRRLLKPAGFEPAVGRVKTFPAVLPLRPLDRVYYRGRLEVVRGYVSRTAVARRAADHLPIVVEMCIL